MLLKLILNTFSCARPLSECHKTATFFSQYFSENIFSANHLRKIFDKINSQSVTKIKINQYINTSVTACPHIWCQYFERNSLFKLIWLHSIIIIILFNLPALPNNNGDDHKRAKKTSSIEYGELKRRKEFTKKRSPDGLTIAQAYRYQGLLCPKAVDELPNYTTPIIHPLPPRVVWCYINYLSNPLHLNIFNENSFIQISFRTAEKRNGVGNIVIVSVSATTIASGNCPPAPKTTE